MGRLNGSDAGAMARKVWVCDRCGLWHYDKPDGCKACGVLATFQFFHSEGEAKRWARLLMLVRAGEVRNVRRQVTFPLMTIGPKGPIEWAKLVADFTYDEKDGDDWVPIVEDYKAVAGMSPDAALKIRCLEAQGIFVRIVTSKGQV
jgi:hypothetical protein